MSFESRLRFVVGKLVARVPPNAERSRQLKKLFILLACCGCFLIRAAARADETITAEELAAVKRAEQARIDVVEKVHGSVVCIYGLNRQGGGSGVLFSPEGFALTNYHVVSGAGQEGWGGLADGELYRWDLVGLDPGGDLAVIQLAGQDHFPTAALGDSRAVRVGDWALAMGNPFALADDQKPSLSLGIVSGVERYQKGSGKNSLVYGNCIQVDSSINPGNSGGPLFNLAGQVIGINGRASFEERGRVNVGAGYAISMQQIKNFLPDLLAAKTAAHGTLDAVFEDRTGGVICQQINLNSTIAGLGMDLGDRLISFDGRPIASANQYLNLITVLPAKWPVEVTFEHQHVIRTVWLRLDALTYARPPSARRAKKDTPSPQRQPEQDRDKDPKGQSEPGGDKSPLPKTPKIAREQPKPLDGVPGKIRDRKLNLEQCRRILRDWKRTVTKEASDLSRIKAIQTEEQVIDPSVGPEPIERRLVVFAPDGRFRVTLLDLRDKTPTGAGYGWDGNVFWSRSADGKMVTHEAADAQDELDASVAIAALAALYQGDPAAALGKLELEGGDKTQAHRAFRLRGQLASGQTVYLWFSALEDDQSQLRPRLLKIAAARDDEPSPQAWTMGQFQRFDGIELPASRRYVEGLAERPGLEVSTVSCRIWEESIEEMLARPSDAPSEK